MRPQYYTWYVASRAANQTAVRRESKRRVKEMLTAQEKPILHVPYVRSLLPDTTVVSMIRCRRAKEILRGGKVNFFKAT